MLQLARVHLQGLGPPDARFDPLTLDLREEKSRRPGHSVVWLANGGGKTTLLRLIFHVLRYSDARKIGKELPGVHTALAGLLGAKDVGHVALEWQWTGAARRLGEEPERIVTGLVCSWRTGRESGGAADIARHFYSMTVQPDLGFEDLLASMVEDGRRVPHLRWVAALRDLAKELPAADIAITEQIARWESHLLTLGIDSALFRYQIEMNQGEGGADGLFAHMRTPRDVVEFLLRTTVAPASLDGLDEELDAYAEKIARRPTLEAERRFVERLGFTLDGLATAADVHAVAVEDERRARRDAAQLRRALEAAAEQCRQELARVETQHAAALGERTVQDGLRSQAARRAAGLERWIAQAERDTAAEVRERARAVLADAELTQESWALMSSVSREAASVERIALLDRLIAREHEGLQPLRDELSRHLGRLFARLDGLLAGAEIERTRLVTERDAAAAEMSAARAAVAAAESARDGAERRRAGAEQRVDEWRRRLDHLRSRGIMAPEERVPAALARQAAAGSAAVQRQEDAAAEEAAAREAGDVARAAAAEAVLSASHSRALIDDLTSSADELDREAAELRDAPLVVEVLEGRAPKLPEDGPQTLVALLGEAAAADREAVRLAERGTSDDRDLAYVAEHGVLPARHDSAVVVERLRAVGVEAAGGADHVRRAIAAEAREAAMARHPGLPDAVVVHCVTEEVVAAVASLAGEVRHAVEIVADDRASAPALGVRGHDGTWDREAAAAWAHEAEARASARTPEIERNQKRREDAGRMRHRIDAHLRVWDAAARTAHDAKLRAAREARERAQAEVAEQESIVASQAGVVEAVRSDGEQAARDLENAERNREEVEALGHLDASADADQAVVTRERAAAREALDQAELTSASAERAEQRRAEADRDREEARVTADRWRREVARLAARREQADRAPADDGDATLEAILAAVDALDAELARRSTFDELARERQAAHDALRAARNEVQAASPGVRQRAAELLRQPGAEDAEHRAQGLDAARRRAAAAREDAAAAMVRLGAAERLLAEASSLPDQVAPEPSPVDAARARRQLIDHVDQQEAASAALRRVEATLRTLDPERIERRRVVDRLIDIAGALDGDDAEARLAAPDVNRLTDPEVAIVARDDARRAIRDADTASARTLEARERTFAKVQDVLLDPDYDAVGGTLRHDLRQAGVERLVNEAASLADRLRQRAELIADTLASLARDRSVVATTLAKEVDSGLRLLRRVETRSQLPEGLGPWTGQSVVRFSGLVRPQELAEVVARVEATLDRLVVLDSRPRGADLLVRAVVDLVDSPTLDVKILKPNAGEPGVPQPVSLLPTFSGGQRATVAILLYATLARVRADELRRRGSDVGVGVLILDNPLGKASAGFLVEQQLRVADANAIQLVYATGVGDFDALDRFPVRARLRNRGVVGRALRRVVDEGQAERIMGAAGVDGLEAVHHQVDGPPR